MLPSLPFAADYLLWALLSLALLWVAASFQRAWPGAGSARPSGLGLLGLYLASIGGLYLLTAFYQHLVFSASIPIDFDNVFKLEAGTVVTLLAGLISSIAFFLFTHRLMRIGAAMGIGRHQRFGWLLAAVLLTLPLAGWLQIGVSPLSMCLIAFSYLLLFDIYTDYGSPTFTWVAVWLCVFSAYSALLLYKYTLDHDLQTRHAYARVLADPQDSTAVAELRQLHADLRRLPADSLVPLHPDTIAAAFARRPYLFQHYRYELCTDASCDRIGAAEPVVMPSGTYGLRLGTGEVLKVRFAPRHRSRVYDELLPVQPYKGLPLLDRYDFALLSGQQVQYERGAMGDFVQWYLSAPRPEPGGLTTQNIGTCSGLAFRGADGQSVLISRDVGGYFKPLSLFSYLFALQVLLLLALSGINRLTGALPSSGELPILGRSSLRWRIQLSVVLLFLGAFVLIGIVTTSFFRNSSEQSHEAQFTHTLGAVLRDLRTKIATAPDTASLLSHLAGHINTIADVQDVDINLYTPQGQIAASSAQHLFDQGVLPPSMSAVVRQRFSGTGQELISYQERTGEQSYKTAYAQLSGPGGQTLAFVAVPYFARDRNLRDNVYQFMGALLNVYVFLLLIAVVIAIATANSITQPIARMGEKLRSFRLGNKNEPLAWESQDEIGELVAAYNTMIAQVEDSTEKLKQSEREMAWREMAKQVAHEIKNPLTPMKLSIQHLMRVSQVQPERTTELLKRTADTLIEQIDDLTDIATAFSNFAKMPKAANEPFLLNEAAAAVFELFTQEAPAGTELLLDISPQPCTVYADRAQIMRVINNLVKNALQAIPPERAGRIAMSLRCTPDDNSALLTVADNGCGIPADMREKVFYPNFTTKSSGMGLGLAMCKDIVEAAGGRLWFDTDEGEGTRFFVRLPLWEA